MFKNLNTSSPLILNKSSLRFSTINKNQENNRNFGQYFVQRDFIIKNKKSFNKNKINVKDSNKTEETCLEKNIKGIKKNKKNHQCNQFLNKSSINIENEEINSKENKCILISNDESFNLSASERYMKVNNKSLIQNVYQINPKNAYSDLLYINNTSISHNESKRKNSSYMSNEISRSNVNKIFLKYSHDSINPQNSSKKTVNPIETKVSKLTLNKKFIKSHPTTIKADKPIRMKYDTILSLNHKLTEKNSNKLNAPLNCSMYSANKNNSTIHNCNSPYTSRPKNILKNRLVRCYENNLNYSERNASKKRASEEVVGNQSQNMAQPKIMYFNLEKAIEEEKYS